MDGRSFEHVPLEQDFPFLHVPLLQLMRVFNAEVFDEVDSLVIFSHLYTMLTVGACLLF